MVGDLDPALAPLHVCGVQIETLKVGDPARSVHDQVEVHGLGPARPVDRDLVTGVGLLNRGDRRGAPQLDPGFGPALDE